LGNPIFFSPVFPKKVSHGDVAKIISLFGRRDNGKMEKREIPAYGNASIVLFTQSQTRNTIRNACWKTQRVCL